MFSLAVLVWAAAPALAQQATYAPSRAGPIAAAPGAPAPRQTEAESVVRRGPGDAPGSAEPLQGYSLLLVTPPKPRGYKVHELVSIVVDETSRQQADQTMNTDKKYNNTANLNAILDPMELLELRLRQGDLKNLKMLDLDTKAKFDGKGKYERNDRLSLKIEAEIIDVKPNGVLVLEARKVIDKNGETSTTVLSGLCRQEDITANNTVFSSQLANLTLVTTSTGQVNDAGKKGLITRVLETLFAF
jgi:flagellar L-ring protein precursor FlgH